MVKDDYNSDGDYDGDCGVSIEVDARWCHPASISVSDNKGDSIVDGDENDDDRIRVDNYFVCKKDTGRSNKIAVGIDDDMSYMTISMMQIKMVLVLLVLMTMMGV